MQIKKRSNGKKAQKEKLQSTRCKKKCRDKDSNQKTISFISGDSKDHGTKMYDVGKSDVVLDEEKLSADSNTNTIPINILNRPISPSPVRDR